MMTIAQWTKTSKKQEKIKFRSPLSMQVLGGFMTVLGGAAVALALTVLSGGVFGLVFGVAGILAGVGLFATGTYRNCQMTSSDECSDLPVYTG